MIKIYQQNFVPASRGLIKSAPSSLIPDGSFQDALNVRFGDGFVEKVKGFENFLVPNEEYVEGVDDEEEKYKELSLDNKIIKIDLFKKTNGEIYNLVHTPDGLYEIENDVSSPENLVPDTLRNRNPDPYYVSEFGHIQSVSAFDEYIYTSFGTPICYLNINPREGNTPVVQDKVFVLEGTYDPPERIGNHAYNVGDVVKPPSYNGYVYRCIQSGTTASSQPDWKLNLVEPFSDGTVRWLGIGSLKIEGNSQTNLTAQCIELYKGFLFVANTMEGSQDYPYRLRWSQWQNPRMWHNNEDGSGLANYVDVDDTEGKIVAIKKLNDTLYVYKEKSIIAVTFTGEEDTTFTKEVITTRAGLVSQEAIVELPHMHIFIGSDNVYMFDGNTCVPIGDPVKDWVLHNIRPDKIDRIFGYYNKDSGDVTFSFCSTVNEQDNCDKAIIYNVSQRVWSAREMYITAIGQFNQTSDRKIDAVQTAMNEDDSMIDSGLFLKDSVLTMAGDENGDLYILRGNIDSRLDNFDGYVVTKTHHMDAPDRIKRLMRIQFHIETAPADYNLYCKVGAFWNAEEINKYAEDEHYWTPKLYMNLEKPDPWYNHHVAPFVDVDLSARYFVVKFGTENNGEHFKILGYTLYYQLRSDE